MNKLNRYYISQNISIDNALSMNQILHQIVNEIKGIVDFINNLELRANEYTDEQIALLNERLQAQLETLEQTLKTYTNDKINEYDAEVINPQLTEIRNTIDTINRTINARIDNEVGILNRKINSEVSTLNRIIEDTKTYLEDLIKKGMSYVYSSISGLHLPLQDVLGEIGNVLKQTLSYNWNSIDEFKTIDTRQFKTILNDFNTYYNTSQFIVTKGINYNDVLDENNKRYVYIKYNCDSVFDNMNIGDTLQVACGGGNDENTISSFSGPATLEKIDNNIIRFDIMYTNVGIGVDYDYAFTALFDNPSNPSPLFDDLSKCELYYTKTSGDVYNITFNSIKTTMEYLEVNYNSLAYTGVNTFYELNETEKLFDTDGVKSDYFTGNKYKTIHNNFDSDFFKSNIN